MVMRRYLYRLYFRISKTLNIHVYLRALLSVLPFRFYEIAFWKYAQEKGKSYTIPFPDTNDYRCVKFYGFKSIDEYCTNLEMRNTTPQYVIYKNATYHPCNGSPLVNSGLYSDNGDIIKESCLFRGTHKSEMITAIKPYDPSLEKIYLNDSYIYGGPIVAHYGHFLTECIGRLWYLLEQHKIDSFLLFHGNKSTLKIDFIKKILKNLPIQEDRIIILDHVAQLAEVIIPLPSMTNRGEIFTIHRKLPIKVAESILNSREIKHTNQPVYLSRRRLSLGYRVILNERKLENRLKKYKVKIIYPEELAFAEEVVLFNSHSVIIGPLGSAHHTNMFSLNKLTQIYLCHSSTIKNYYLLDYTNNNSSHYIMCCHRPFWESNRPDVSSLVIDIDYAIASLKRIGVI
jgi:hypothetical protein